MKTYQRPPAPQQLPCMLPSQVYPKGGPQRPFGDGGFELLGIGEVMAIVGDWSILVSLVVMLLVIDASVGLVL